LCRYLTLADKKVRRQNMNMVKLRKTKTEAPPSMLGIAMFNVNTSTIQLQPIHVVGIVVAFIVIELLLAMLS